MHIEIHLPRPVTTLLAVAAVSGWAMALTSSGSQTASVIEAPPLQASLVGQVVTSSSAAAVPVVTPEAVSSVPNAIVPDVHTHDEEEDEANSLTQAEMRVKWARAEQEYLRERQDIIRAQLEGLQKERDALGGTIDPALEEQFRRSVQMLTSLVKDEKKAEQFLLMNYRQQWEAEEHAMAAATGKPSGDVRLFWPVEPKVGISAYFLDPAYKTRFKVDHYAIDIPVLQGTTVLAAADGIIKDVVDHGLGYNYVTVDHGGYATIYGHMSKFSVRPGQRVQAGAVLGLSGGMPGLPGGGSSTGPHLHFGLYLKGVPVDPLKYLPKFGA